MIDWYVPDSFLSVVPHVKKNHHLRSLDVLMSWRKLCLPLTHLTAACRASAFSLPSHASSCLRSSSRSSQRGFASMSDAAGIKSVVVIVAMEGTAVPVHVCDLCKHTAVPRASGGTKGDDEHHRSVVACSSSAQRQHTRREKNTSLARHPCFSD